MSKTSRSGSTRKASSRKSSRKSNRITSQGVFVRKNRTRYPENAWVVFTTQGDLAKAPRVFDSSLTRDDVRNAYAVEFGIRIQETRSRRVKNFNY